MRMKPRETGAFSVVGFSSPLGMLTKADRVASGGNVKDGK
jgi:hypothetical protein